MILFISVFYCILCGEDLAKGVKSLFSFILLFRLKMGKHTKVWRVEKRRTRFGSVDTQGGLTCDPSLSISKDPTPT